jgi:hypothetical protein
MAGTGVSVARHGKTRRGINRIAPPSLLRCKKRLRAIGALVKRGLIEDDEHATDAGRTLLARTVQRDAEAF